MSANTNTHPTENVTFLSASNDGPQQTPHATSIPLTNTQPTAVQYKYVDQNGNPIVPTQTVVVKYVDQNGNPINPPPIVVNQPTTNTQETQPIPIDPNGKRKQYITVSIGLITALIWIIGLSMDELATSMVGDATCGFSEYHIGGISTSYSDLCDLEWETSWNSNSYYDTDSDDDMGSWCSMLTMAMFVYIFMIGSLVMVVFAVLSVQPWISMCQCTQDGCCKCKRFCCTETWFTLSGIINLLALVFWFIDTGRQCRGEMYSSWGGSIVCFLIGAIFVAFGESAARLLPRK